MSLSRRIDPFQEIARMENEMQKVFDNVFGDRSMNVLERTYAPLMDLRETDDKYFMEVDLPGFKKDDIKIDATNESIEINASKKSEHEDIKNGEYVLRERLAHQFHRELAFPTLIKVENIKITFVDGTLKIELPKEESAKKRPIKID